MNETPRNPAEQKKPSTAQIVVSVGVVIVVGVVVILALTAFFAARNAVFGGLMDGLGKLWVSLFGS